MGLARSPASSSKGEQPLRLQRLLLLLLLSAPCTAGDATAGDAPALVSAGEDSPPSAVMEGGGAVGAERTAEQGQSVSSGLNVSGPYSPDIGLWLWPTANDANAENLIHSILSTWCADTYVDAVKDAQAKAARFDKMRAERDERYSDWMRCTQEKSIREREMEMECERERTLRAAALEREHERIQSECEADGNQLKADLEDCNVKLKKKGVGVCQKELAAERQACETQKQGLKEPLAACQRESRPSNVPLIVALEETALRAAEEVAGWAQEKKRLAAEVADCRPSQAKARERLLEVLTDGKVGELEAKVMWLQLVVLNLLLVLSITCGVAIMQLHRESRGDVEGGHGWIQTMPPARLRLADANTARQQLEEALEKGKGSRLAIVLATDILYGRRKSYTGPNNVFLLVPINITSARRFQLFNQGGDYTALLERAREIVAKTVENPNLLIVLYEAGGCVFTEATLQSLRLTADKVAHEAIPSDSDFPQAENIVVLWLDKQEGLRATDCMHERDDVTDNIKLQPWAQFLLMRSGRWGQVHAQFL